jgi:hypothetical protein
VVAFPQSSNQASKGPLSESTEGGKGAGRRNGAFTHEPERFTKIIAVLEAQSCARLNSPARELCLEAFKATPVGFEVLATRASVKARSNALGLLIKMVQQRDHLLATSGGLGAE